MKDPDGVKIRELQAEVERLRAEKAEDSWSWHGVRSEDSWRNDVRELRAEVERLRDTNDKFIAKHNALADSNQRLTNEVERLRTALERIRDEDGTSIVPGVSQSSAVNRLMYHQDIARNALAGEKE
jgi:chromosome segregation ATPase